jgi:cytochrome c nitrite reductase small subunit
MKTMFLQTTPKFSVSELLTYGIIAGVVISLLLGAAYQISSDSRFCTSCHSMKLAQTRLQTTHHRQFACIECHMPDTNIASRVIYKTRAGMNDLKSEFFRDYPAGIELSEAGSEIINQNCLRCHTSTIAKTPMSENGGNCLKCHRFVVHGRGVDEGGIKVE